MSIASADIHKAINVVWDVSTLDTLFKALWEDPTSTEFPVLQDQEGTPTQPFAYVVFEQTSSSTVERSSADGNTKREIRDIEVRWNIHARAVDGDGRDAKEIAAYLAEEIMKVFGGHPTVNPTGTMTLDNGKHLITQYINDFGVRTGDDEYQWVLIYNMRVDVPVAV